MAKIYQTKNSLETKVEETKTYFVPFLVFELFMMFISPTIAVFFFIIYAITMGGIHSQRNIYKSGLEGEEYAAKALTKLDDSYSVFCDLVVPFDSKTSQVDAVVVGDNGLFVVEIKNINGKVSGNIDDKNLSIKKTGRKGGIYFKEMYNPHKQTKTHVYRLSNFLEENKVNVWVDGLVFFKPIDGFWGEKEVIYVSGAEGIMFDNADALLEKIKSANRTIRKEDKLEIINVLKQLVENKQEQQS